MHKPVLLQEIVEGLDLENGDVVLDATVGGAGHAKEIIKKIMPDGMLIGLDQDENALKIADENLKESFGKNSYKLIKGNFGSLDAALKEAGVMKLDGVVFDLGVSSFCLDDGSRGFSISHNGPLDMRMDNSKTLSAYDVVNKYPKDRLEGVIRDLGEERYARKIASSIIECRKRSPIKTTAELADIVKRAVGRGARHLKVHPATRTFQAIRIEVNRELECLSEGLLQVINVLAEGARILVISFHSLEDRIVKNIFRESSRNNILKIITKKPITPCREEIISNARARSAKLRIAERMDKV